MKATVADMTYVRTTSEPTHDLKFRSTDRFLPNGTVSSGNGGWWEIEGPFYPVARVMTAHATTATQAIVAIGEVIESRGFGEMFFDKKAGDYHVEDSSGSGVGGRHVLGLSTAGVDIRITGNGANIYHDGVDVTEYSHFVRAVALGKSSRIHIDGITYRYTNRPYVTGVVTAVSAGNYIDITADWVPTFSYVMVGKSYTDKRLDGVFYYAPEVDLDGLPIAVQNGMTYRIDITGATLTLPTTGQDVVFVHRKYDAHFFAANDIGDLYVGPNLLIEDAAGMGVYVNKGGSVHIDGARIAPNPADRVPFALNADGWHIKSCLNTRIENTEVSFTGDDSLAVGSVCFNIVSRDSATQLTATKAFLLTLAVGDFIQIFDADRLLSVETRIVSIDAQTSTEIQITVADALAAGVDDTYQLAVPSLTAIVAGNTLGDTAYRGMICFARSLLIDGNHINRTGGPGIIVYSSSDHHCYIDNYAVKGNKLTKTNTVGVWSSAIVVRPTNTTGALLSSASLTTAAAFKVGDISGNTINESKQGGIGVCGTGTVAVQGNAMANIATSASALDGFTGAAVALYGVAEATVDGNTAAGATLRDIACITVAKLRVGQNVNIHRSTTLTATTTEAGQLPSFNVATLPASPPVGQLAYMSDAGGGASLAYSGTGNLWRHIPNFTIFTTTGDNDFTRTPLQSLAVDVHTGTLTADRAVTLSTTNAINGSFFIFARTGAGAFNLSIGGLKNLATNTWCMVMYNGSAWVLIMYGAL